MSMAVELVLLAALIIIFIASFCGLLQKIRKTYEHERVLAERANNGDSPRISFTEVYVNPSFGPSGEDRGQPSTSHGIFPSAPPPYTETLYESPPKYEDLFKFDNTPVRVHQDTN